MMNRERVATLLKTTALGRNAVFLKSVDSTNLEAKRMARLACPHGQLVVSEHQHEGRGRRGKSWSDEKGKSVCMSLVLRPFVAPELLPRYPLAAALGLYEALLSLGVRAGIKWPNDLLVEGRKLSGILLEAGTGAEGHFFVAGIGVNVNQLSFSGELRGTAASLRMVADREFEREAVLSEALNALEPAFSLCETDEGFARLLTRYTAASCTLGKQVDIIGVDTSFTGVAEALDQLGRLMVRTENGALETVSAGDVSLRNSIG